MMRLTMLLARLTLAFVVAVTASAVTAACGDGGDATSAGQEVDVPDTAKPDISGLEVIVWADDTADGDAADGDAAPADVPAGDTGAAPDTSGGGDTGGACNTFGCPCATSGDCLDELCIAGVDGRICTKTCVADYPEGFDCVSSTAFGPDPISVCVPRHARLCRPCRAHADCQDDADPFPAYCLPAPDPAEGSFCGSGCSNRPCPEGYACETVSLPGGGSAQQCVPAEGGRCECRPTWDGLGFTTTCLIENGYGACEGTRTCGAFGLTPCEGPQATAEICNGVDDDCNGVTDDIEALPCQVQNLFGSCPGTTVCGEDGPTCAGQTPVAEECNGINDDCDGQTDEDTCDDGLSCTVDSCAGPFDCRHALVNGWCAIAGACYAAGAFNPADACAVCDPAKSTSAWSPAPNACVIAGQCYPANAVNPANACEVCDPSRSTVTWSQPLNTCNIQGACFAAGATKPGQPCLRCVPEQNPSGWTPAATNTPCDDGSACSTDDHCNAAGECVGDTSCDDGVPCTEDVCTAGGCDHAGVPAGWCRIDGACYTTNTARPTNVCERCDPGASQTSWSPQPSSVACSDGNACTTGDHCDGAGHCSSGPGCSDGLSCTTDVCNPAVGCSYPTAPGKCKINDACYSNGQQQPGNVCFKCDTAVSQSSWSYNNGNPCNDGDACTYSDRCSAGACEGTPDEDSYEDNDAMYAAHQLTDTDDAADWPKSSISANLYPSGDADWFRFKDKDNTNVYQPHPKVQLTGIPSGVNYNLCAYWQCDDVGDGQSVDCESGSGSSWNGKPGCCSTASGSASETVKFKPDCKNGGFFTPDDETGTVYIRVYRASGPWTCDDYTLKWGDD